MGRMYLRGRNVSESGIEIYQRKMSNASKKGFFIFFLIIKRFKDYNKIKYLFTFSRNMNKYELNSQNLPISSNCGKWNVLIRPKIKLWADHLKLNIDWVCFKTKHDIKEKYFL